MDSLSFHAIYRFLIRHICEFIVLCCLYFSFHQQKLDNNCEKLILADGLGYFSYLPAIFIYNDYQFSFTKEISEKYPQMNFGQGFLSETDSGKVNKYYCGLAALLLPFFLIAHFLSILLGFPADGYSLLYQFSVLFAANFYLWVGCKYCRKLFMTYSVSEDLAAFILLLLVFGTNLFFYATFYPSFTHVYSFAAISAFLFSVHSFFKGGEKKSLYLSAFLLGIIVLLRPTNFVIILMYPFFAGNMKIFWSTLKNILKSIPIALGIFLITITPQFLLYFLQSGQLITWSYGNEKFFFDNPQFLNVLFSYQKGLFVYTPLAWVGLFGLVPLFKVNKFQFSVMISFLLLTTYIISSWWCWWYGGGLGQRVYVDYYAILGLFLTFLLLSFKNSNLKLAFYVISSLLVYYSLLLTYQYRHNIIDPAGMNKKKFWFTFLKTDPKIAGFVSTQLYSDTQSENVVNIKSSKGKYICAERDESYHILANRDSAANWEAFNMILLDNNKIALKSDNGKYVSARLDNENVLTYSAYEIGAWETFEKMILNPKGEFMLKAYNGKFVMLKGDTLYASADSLDQGEHFTYLKNNSYIK